VQAISIHQVNLNALPSIALSYAKIMQVERRTK